MTKREKRLQDLRRKIARRERDREQGIKLLVKAVIELPSLRRQLDRLERGWHPRNVTKVERTIAQVEGFLKGEDLTNDPSDPGEIPEVLRREVTQPESSPLRPEVYDAAYAVANKHNKLPTKEQQDLVAKEKRKVKEEIKHAELTGQRRKMPLTGREAERALRK